MKKTCRGRRIHTKEIRDSGFWRRKIHLDWSFGWGCTCTLAVVIILKLGCLYRLDSVHFGCWILKYHLDWSYWWICDRAVLDGWISQEANWDFCARWKIYHHPSPIRVVKSANILTFRFHYRPVLDCVLDLLGQLLHEKILVMA